MTKAAKTEGPISETRAKNAVVRVGRIADITAEGEVWVHVGDEPAHLAWSSEHVPLAALHQALREQTPE